MYICGRNSVLTSQRTQPFSILKTIRLILLREVVAVYCENDMKDMNRQCGEKTQFLTVAAGGACVYH
jgi:hypothetical protein